jgi:two-component system NtrC family sensor kinase
MTYEGRDIGTATIFQDDVRISTNVRNTDGSRAIGTRAWEEVYDQVVLEGRPWIGRAYVVNDWYITAYEPITDLDGRIIGMLYVGILEKRYVDIQREMLLIFLGIALLGTLVSMGLAYFAARRISVPIARLAGASRELALGNLNARVKVASGDVVGELAESFNSMSSALQEAGREAQRLRHEEDHGIRPAGSGGATLRQHRHGSTTRSKDRHLLASASGADAQR